MNGYKIEPGADLRWATLPHIVSLPNGWTTLNLHAANLSWANLTGATMPDGTIHD